MMTTCFEKPARRTVLLAGLWVLSCQPGRQFAEGLDAGIIAGNLGGSESLGTASGAGGADPFAGQTGGSSGLGGAGGTTPGVGEEGGAPNLGCAEAQSRTCSEAGMLGNCAAGEQACVDGVYSACSIEPQAADSCDPGDDADCDGRINEDCGCVEGTVQACAVSGALGNCASGQQTCENGAFTECSVQPLAEDSCATPGDDADCDGSPNGGCTCNDGDTANCGPTTDAGICEFGVSTCVDGAWSACQGGVYPQARDCRSSADNDCDGEADDTVGGNCACSVGASRSCDTHPGQDGMGRCMAGSQTCIASGTGSASFWGTCSGAVGPASADSCSSLGDDSNCDGEENGGCECVQPSTTTCAAEYGRQGDCGLYQLSCGSNGTWPSENSACSATGGDSCAASGQCLGGVWDSQFATFDDVCFQ